MDKKTGTADIETIRRMKAANRKNEETGRFANAVLAGEPWAVEELRFLVEYNESFFTGFNAEKFERYKRMKSLCQTISDMDITHRFRLAGYADPANRDHGGNVYIDLPDVCMFEEEEYEAFLEIAKLADGICLSSVKRGKIRLSFVVKGVFYDENLAENGERRILKPSSQKHGNNR